MNIFILIIINEYDGTLVMPGLKFHTSSRMCPTNLRHSANYRPEIADKNVKLFDNVISSAIGVLTNLTMAQQYDHFISNDFIVLMHLQIFLTNVKRFGTFFC